MLTSSRWAERNAHSLDQLLDCNHRLDGHDSTLPPNVLISSCVPNLERSRMPSWILRG